MFLKKSVVVALNTQTKPEWGEGVASKAILDLDEYRHATQQMTAFGITVRAAVLKGTRTLKILNFFQTSESLEQKLFLTIAMVNFLLTKSHISSIYPCIWFLTGRNYSSNTYVVVPLYFNSINDKISLPISWSNSVRNCNAIPSASTSGDRSTRLPDLWTRVENPNIRCCVGEKNK